MDAVAVLLVIGFLVIFGLLVFYSIRSKKKSEARKNELVSAAGFTPVPEPSRQVSQRIIQLYENPRHKRLKLSNVWVKPLPPGEMYLFDLSETSGEDDTQLADQALLFVSPDLQMPRFSLLSRLEVGGKLGEVANRMMFWAASCSGRPIELLGQPEFDRRYWVSGEDHNAIRAFLTPDRLNFLASTQNYSLEAGGDAFAFTRTIYPAKQGQKSTTTLPDLNQNISGAMQLYRWLSTRQNAFIDNSPSSSLQPSQTQCHQCGATLTLATETARNGVCLYCGSPLEIPNLERSTGTSSTPDQYSDPIGLNSDEWKIHAKDEWIRSGTEKKASRLSSFLQASACSLPFSLGWTAFSAIFLVVGVVAYINERRAFDLLTREGVSSVATITDLFETTDSEGGTTYYVDYRYAVPISGDTSWLTARQSVPEALYQSLESGMQVEILYAAAQPSVSDIKANFGPPGLMLPICFGGMGSLFTLIGLAMIVGSLGAMGRALLNID